ncbi:MAG TPA: amidohydrolase family protein, partial [Terriglobia bacterium]|nr:amidohydrolase family protein [Terriglobia bacterium]
MKRYSLLFVTLMCVLVCGPLWAQSVQPKIIDGHVHYNGDPAFLQKLLAKLDSVDGMAFLLVSPADMDTAVPFIHAHPNRLIGFANIDMDSTHALEQIDLAHEAGFRGLGELEYVAHNFDDPVYFPIYKRAEKYRMILLFHTGIVNREHPNVPTNVSISRMQVMRLDLIARMFPKITIIGAHMGNPDYAWAAEIGRWNPNVYFDLSGSSLIKKQNDYTFFKSIFWWSGVVSPHTPKSEHSAFEKLVFGSDVFGGDLPEFDRELKRYHEMLDACDVPKKAQEYIFSGTLWHILQQQKEA